MRAALDAEVSRALRALGGTERDRAMWSAASDARAVHYQKPQTCGEDDEELDFGFDLADGGAGAEDVRAFDERRDASFYTQRIKVARRRLARNVPELVEVFNLVVKNGKNRRESIAELAARGLSPDAAKILYWKHLKKISLFFGAQ